MKMSILVHWKLNIDGWNGIILEKTKEEKYEKKS